MNDTIRVGLVLITLVLATAAGRAAGGRLRDLDRLPYRGLRLLGWAIGALLAGVLLAVAGAPPRATEGVGLALAALLVLAFCLRSRAVPGLGLVAAGLLLNAVVVLGNGAMPVSAYAAARAGVDLPGVADSRHLIATADTTLGRLGDVIPVPLPLRPEVVSVGDLLGAAGTAQLVLTAMLAGAMARRRRTTRRGTRPAMSPEPPSAAAA